MKRKFSLPRESVEEKHCKPCVSFISNLHSFVVWCGVGHQDLMGVFMLSSAARGLLVGWLLNVPATCKRISGTNLLRQFYVLPHWDRSCRPNIPSHPVYWHRADQSQRWPYIARRLAGQPLEFHFLSHWYDSTPEKSRRKRDSNPGSSAPEAVALTTWPTRRSACMEVQLNGRVYALVGSQG